MTWVSTSFESGFFLSHFMKLSPCIWGRKHLEDVGNDTEALSPWVYVRLGACSATGDNHSGMFQILPLTYLMILEELRKSFSSFISKMGVSILIYIIRIFWTMTNIGISNLLYTLIDKDMITTWVYAPKKKIVIKINRTFPELISITLKIKFTRFSLFFPFSMLESPTKCTLIVTDVAQLHKYWSMENWFPIFTFWWLIELLPSECNIKQEVGTCGFPVKGDW